MITIKWFWHCIHHNIHLRWKRRPWIQYHRGFCLCEVNEILKK